MAFVLNLPKIAPLAGFRSRNPFVRLLLDLFSFEALFVLFLFAGRYKGDPRFAFIPGDPTVLFLVASMAVGIVLLFQEKLYVPGVYALGMWVFFLAYMWIGLVWGEGRSYGREKLLLTTVMDTWCLIAGAMIMANARERVARLMRLITLFAFWLGTEVLLNWSEQGFRGRVFINNGDDYLGFGRVCGMGAIICCAFWATRTGFGLARIGLTALVGMFLMVLLAGGGRGPLIAGVLPMLLIAVIGWKVTRSGQIRVMKMQIPILLALIGMVGVAVYALTTPGGGDLGSLETLSRLRGVASGDLASGSDIRRSQNVEQAMVWIPRAPVFGHGVGSWPVVVYNSDFHDHPHNMILEILFEFGMVGLALMAGVFWACLRGVNVHRLRTDPLFLAASMLTINVFLNAMTSGDLPENRQVFAMLGLLLMRAPLEEDEDSTDDEGREFVASPDIPWDDDGDLAAFRRLRAASNEEDESL